MSLLDPKAIRDWCKTTFHKNSDILQTIAEVEENENVGKTVDALAVKEVFQSVSNGKSLIASAITDKGVQTDATATFQEMATNIGQIETGGGSGNVNWSVAFLEKKGFYSTISFNLATGVESVTVNVEEG